MLPRCPKSFKADRANAELQKPFPTAERSANLSCQTRIHRRVEQRRKT